MTAPNPQLMLHDDPFVRDVGNLHMSSYQSFFLTPPLSPHSSRDKPFKPSDSDKASLNMKKRHHREHNRARKRYRRASVADSYSDMVQKPEDEASKRDEPRARSKSLPHLQNRTSLCYNQDAAADRMPTLTRPHSRRWKSVPKSSPTSEVTKVATLGKPNRSASNTQSRSPAVITLRRATENPQRKTSITFFPPPTFNRAKSNFMSYFLTTTRHGNQEYGEHGISENMSGQEPSAKVASWSVPGSGIQPTTNNNASPTTTKVTFNPEHSPLPFPDNLQSRTCSTRYISRSSVYEVIWDENDALSSDSSSDTSPKLSISLSPSARKQSAAVTELETQLLKAVAQSRRESTLLAYRRSYEDFSETQRKRSFSSMLNSAMSRLINESALHNLPRSKASRTIGTGPASTSHVAAKSSVQQPFLDDFTFSVWNTPEDSSQPHPSGTVDASLNFDDWTILNTGGNHEPTVDGTLRSRRESGRVKNKLCTAADEQESSTDRAFQQDSLNGDSQIGGQGMGSDEVSNQCASGKTWSPADISGGDGRP